MILMPVIMVVELLILLAVVLYSFLIPVTTKLVSPLQVKLALWMIATPIVMFVALLLMLFLILFVVLLYFSF